MTATNTNDATYDAEELFEQYKSWYNYIKKLGFL